MRFNGKVDSKTGTIQTKETHLKPIRQQNAKFRFDLAQNLKQPFLYFIGAQENPDLTQNQNVSLIRFVNSVREVRAGFSSIDYSYFVVSFRKDKNILVLWKDCIILL